MENPAKLRKRIVLLATSPNRTRVLVVKQNGDSMWSIPDTHLHWPIGKRKKPPRMAASVLASDATFSLLGTPNQIKTRLQLSGERYKLPTGGFGFLLPSESVSTSEAVDNVTKVRKHLRMSEGVTQMHEISNIQRVHSHSSYTSGTIEAVRSVFG